MPIVRIGRDIPEESATAQELFDRQGDLRANKCAVVVFTPGNSEDPKVHNASSVLVFGADYVNLVTGCHAQP
jgi:hypothetical protein